MLKSADKYLSAKVVVGGEVAKMVCRDLYKPQASILLLRSTTTGMWIDSLFETEANVTRIMYSLGKRTECCNFSTILLDYSELVDYIGSLNKKFDLICMDTFHEYTESSQDFSLLISYLSDTGVLISHDCSPAIKDHAEPLFKGGFWCGVTYAAFVEVAYKNPQWFYGVLDTDTGVGIVSKTELGFLSSTLNGEKQKHLLELIKEDKDAYTYFRENGKELINLTS